MREHRAGGHPTGRAERRGAIAVSFEHTSPAAVAASLARALERKRARFGNARPVHPASPPLPPVAPKLPEKRTAVDAGFDLEQWLSARKQEKLSLGRSTPRLAPALAVLTSHALTVKDALTGLIEPLQARSAAEAKGQGAATSAHFEQALDREVGIGKRVLVAAALFVLIWGGLVPLSGAVIVPGTIVLQSSIKKVQHPAGGIVTAILVQNGSKVRAGDALLRLDETSAKTTLQVVARQLDETRVRIARLSAERDGLSEPRWPQNLAAELSPTERRQIFNSERELFQARASARRDQQNLALSRIEQLEKQVSGLEAQLAANAREREITAGELKNVERLLEEKLVTLERVTNLRREAARLEGIDGQLTSQIAETKNRITEMRIQAIQAEEAFRTEVMRDLTEAEARQGELLERRLAADDQHKRTVVRAPVSGTVQELAVHTIGGVISPGEVLLAVVPDGDALEIAARLSPEKIDQVHPGQVARIRLPAFNSRTTPELAGTVAVVSEDIVHDQQGGGYYDVRVVLPPEEVHRLGGLRLVAGMPSEVFLQTERRTLLSYLFKPLSDQLSRTFKER